MSRLFLAFCIGTLLMAGCDLLRAEEEFTVAGTVAYTNGLAPGGGNPVGFILADYEWVRGQPRFEHSGVYVQGGVDSTHLGRRVEVRGEVRKVQGGGFFMRTFAEVVAERVAVIE